MSERNTVEPVASAQRFGSAAEVEAVVRMIWTEILGTEDVAADNTLFDLGGDSVQAMQIVTRIRQAFGQGVEVATIFDGATPRILGQLIYKKAGSQHTAEKAV